MLPSTSQGRSYPPHRPSGQPGESCPRPDEPETDQPSWAALARAWSPRKNVRIDPTREHRYANECPVDAVAADVPYALHLTDEDHQYRLLALDFDAKKDASTAQADAGDLSSRLRDADIDHVVCASGPRGGVHIWIRLASPVPAAKVTQLATALTAAYPKSGDFGALHNPVTGAVRPPGAPHRISGISQPLTRTDVGTVAFKRVVAVIRRLQPHATKTTTVSTATRGDVAADTSGAPYLTGPRRPVSPQVRTLMQQNLSPGADASAVAYSVLLGCAHARMRLSDVQDLAFQQAVPALEHIRTVRAGASRRSRRDAEEHLRRQWERAVTAAAFARPVVATCGSEARQEAQQLVSQLVSAMRAVPRRWNGRTGSQDRLLLEVLATRLLAACRAQVHLSERDWALEAGLTRAVVHCRLGRLVREGWVRRVTRGVGPWAARWALGPGAGESGSGQLFSAREEKSLHRRLELARADIWQAKELGILGLRVWQELRSCWRPVADIAARLDVTVATVRQKLRALQRVRLVTGDGRAYGNRKRLQAAAELAGTAGAHADRERLYRLESASFVWWFTCRYAPNSDVAGEWGEYPSPTQAAEVDPRDIALAYGAESRGVPPEPTAWGAAIVILEEHRHRDPGSWWELVLAARAALPPEDVLAPAHRWVPVAA